MRNILILVCVFVLTNILSAQTQHRTELGVGAGLGLPYGLFGGRVACGGAHIDGSLGLGVLPFAWEAVYSINANLHIGPKDALFRP